VRGIVRVRRSGWVRAGVGGAILVAALAVIPAQDALAQPFAGGGGTQMPDARQMSGVPLPMGDLPVGTVTVRVARGAVTNPLPGISVRLTGGAGAPPTATTDAAGRATFTGLTPGTRVKADATVAGEQLASQEFEVLAAGGVRLALIATDPEMAKKAEEGRRLAASPPIDGTVVLGEQSRIVIEIGDDGLNIFNILQILNTARRPVKIPRPLYFDVPAQAIGLGLLEGAPKNAIASGHRVAVDGPFAPGATLLQFGYTLPFTAGDMSITQMMPAQLTDLAVAVQTNGAMRLSSPQLAQQRQMSADGQSFIVAQGPAVPAGGAVTLNLSGLPHAPTWPRNFALALASVVLLGGAGAAIRRPKIPAGESLRSDLRQRREQLFSSLAALEARHRGGEVDEPRYSELRQDLVGALSRIYVELDKPLDTRIGREAGQP
jgi:hypothetical protein